MAATYMGLLPPRSFWVHPVRPTTVRHDDQPRVAKACPIHWTGSAVLVTSIAQQDDGVIRPSSTLYRGSGAARDLREAGEGGPDRRPSLRGTQVLLLQGQEVLPRAPDPCLEVRTHDSTPHGGRRLVGASLRVQQASSPLIPPPTAGRCGSVVDGTRAVAGLRVQAEHFVEDVALLLGGVARSVHPSFPPFPAVLLQVDGLTHVQLLSTDGVASLRRVEVCEQEILGYLRILAGPSDTTVSVVASRRVHGGSLPHMGESRG